MSQSSIVKIDQGNQTKIVGGNVMNDRFNELPEEKQRAVFNAAIEVFAKYDYKKASTDLIAAKAGVSKGLLFYYFHNKKELYLAVFDYVSRIISESIFDSKLAEITDFFELITYATMKKVKVLESSPYIIDFCVRSFYSEKEDVSGDLKNANLQTINNNYNIYFKKLDYSRFKEGANPDQIFKMLIWMMDGYLHEQQMYGKALHLDEIENELRAWTKMLKSIAYKEEYL